MNIKAKIYLILAGQAESLLNFRGPLIEALQTSGSIVHVAAPELTADSLLKQYMLAKGMVVHSVPIRRNGTNPISDAQTLLALWWLMRRIRPDAVLGYTIKPVIYGSIAAWLAGVPKRFALITGLGYAFQGNGDRNKIQQLVQGLYRIALSHTHKVFFQNPDDLTLFRRRGILSQDAQVCVVNGSGVDISHYAVVPLPNSISFILVARLLGDKGVREYINAAKIIREVHPDVIFALVGAVDSNPDSISQPELDSWLADGVISYYGHLSDVRPAISKSSVFVLPSYREGTPRSVLEAMSMGRAIITTDAPGCRETVINGENGFLVAVRSVDELVTSMKVLIARPELVAEMGKRAREICEEKYDVHKVNAVMLREMGITE